MGRGREGGEGEREGRMREGRREGRGREGGRERGKGEREGGR